MTHETKARRTEDQRFADDLDCDLYRLIMRAEQQSAKDRRWRKVVAALRDARPQIRARMHGDDKARTV